MSIARVMPIEGWAFERQLASRPLFATLMVLVTAWVALLWPAALNGQPFMLHDTTAYIRGAAFPADKFFGVRTIWSDPVPLAAGTSPTSAVAVAAKSLSSVEDKTVFAGRSVYYGSLLFWGFVVGGLWLPVMLQAGIAALAVFLALRHVAPAPIAATLGSLVVLGVATPLSWFAGYLMPDVFAGLGLLAAVLLITQSARMPRIEIGFWVGLLAFALAAHTSHLATSVVLFCLAMGVRLVLRRDWRIAGFAAVAGAIALAMLAEAVFSLAVTRVTGAGPVRPPFMTARVMHSSIGKDYLAAVCPQTQYAVCAYADRAPLIANDFLWNPDPKVGVFAHADAEMRRKLSEEQTRVFFGAFLYAPVTVALELLERWGRLMMVTGIYEFNNGPGERAFFAAKLPPSVHATFVDTPSGRGELPITALRLLFAVSTFGGAALALLLLRGEQRHLGDLALLIGAGVLINAAVCSALSGVEPRYETRIIWLLPFLAFVLCWRRFARRSSAPATVALAAAAA